MHIKLERMTKNTEQARRKLNRLGCFDYSESGAYFITICTQDRKKILSKITVTEGLQVSCELLRHGIVADKWIRSMNGFYEHISVDNYVIMPDHIHLLIVLHGQAGMPAPPKEERRNAEISKFVGSFKRFTGREYGEAIWQRSYYDHVIRNQEDYNEVWNYIADNPRKWAVQKSGTPFL